LIGRPKPQCADIGQLKFNFDSAAGCGIAAGAGMKLHWFVVGLLWVGLSGPMGGAAGQPEPIRLWPGAVPGETNQWPEERDMTKPTDHLVAGRPVIRLGNVSQPTITVYPAPADKATGAAVIVCPGGGYHILAMDLEGTEVIEWLNSIGVTGVLLKYRVPARPGRPRYEPPLQDAQRAISLVRARAGEWGIDPHRIGLMGFSAGAHLSAVASCRFDQRAYTPVDAADQVSCRPDFVLLIYPAYLTVPQEGDKLAPELTVSSNTPATFLVQTEDDNIRVECSLFYYLALKKARVPVEMHLYPSGGHGYGLRPSPHTVSTWPQRAEQWLRALGLLDRRTAK
jgi:acetyl esterase/lipase